MAEEKKYLDYDGLAYLVEKLTNKIEASGSGGGTDAHAVDVLRSVVAFPYSPQTGSDGSSRGSYSPGADDIPLGEVVELADDFTGAAMECEDSRFVLKESGSAKTGLTYYITCAESNGTGSDIHTTLRLTMYFSDGEERTVNVIAVQSAAAASASGTSGHTGACDGVYVAYVAYDGTKRICAPSDWADSLGAAQGVMVGDGSHEVMVSLTDKRSSRYCIDQGSSSYTTFKADGAIDTDDGALAITDLNGRANWAAIMEAADGLGIPYYSGNVCDYLPKLYYGSTHAGEWWLPSLGELKLISDRIDDVNSALSSAGGSTASLVVSKTYKEDFHWSSTQDGVNLWQMSLGTGDVKAYSKEYKGDTDASYLCPVAAWDYVL